MNKVLLLKGLPGSGKSTYAKKLVDKGGWKRVNKDELRAMLDNGKHSDANESFVLNLRDFIITSSMIEGVNIIVDDTNFSPKHEKTIQQMIDLHNNSTATTSTLPMPTYELEVKFIDTPLNQCIRQDLKRPNSVGKDVIMRMYRQSLAPKLGKYTPPKGKPKAIVCDIDGTLAHIPKGGRSPYDYGRVFEDVVDPVIASVIQRYKDDEYEIVLCSGREDDCRDVTIKWLEDKKIPYDKLYMRTAGDNRNDAIVKQELFDANIRDEYQVEFVLDDRNRVVEMWRTGELKVLQVAEGDF